MRRAAGKARVGAALLLALVLAGCGMAPQKPPASTLVMPPAWRTPVVGPESKVERDWWRAFDDPALDALVRKALEHNADLRTARSRLQEYRARVIVAQSAQRPELNANLSPSKSRLIGPFGTPIQIAAITGGVTASYEVDLSGALAATTAAARFDYQTQQAAADAAALSVAATVASGYLNLRGLDAQLVVAHDTLISRQRSFDLARRQFEVGYSSRLELAQAEAELHTAAGVVPQLEQAIGEQENALSVLVGDNPGPVARGRTLSELNAPSIAPGLPSELLRRRPDIAQAEQAVAAADANLAAARDKLLPSLSLNASYGMYAYSLKQLVQEPFQLWSIGASVLAPLFNGGRLRAQADIAASLRDRAVFAYESVVRNAFAETENSLDAIERLGDQLREAQARQLVQAEVLRVAHKRYANGYASYLEELDAQRNLFSAQINVLQLRQNLLAAHVNLYRALGGGWTPGRAKDSEGNRAP
ncbi:efflux transporter outer membrane subunit [Massilia horti]|uniref:Efflux transporter outer membrane subunit n=1 Tax=Massilia horti TaxID=2562153 RepID=A0A4Y9SM17_9BURK|nr:efflux transporter outer membrane subunit [Massilia horti]TFW27588.1 efflux transporter outer membrane subunit [Massilia horti]